VKLSPKSICDFATEVALKTELYYNEADEDSIDNNEHDYDNPLWRLAFRVKSQIETLASEKEVFLYFTTVRQFITIN